MDEETKEKEEPVSPIKKSKTVQEPKESTPVKAIQLTSVKPPEDAEPPKKSSGPTKNEQSEKIFKQHLEICKLQSQLEELQKEKIVLEEEAQNKQAELYELNQKLIMQEINTSQITVQNDYRRSDMQQKIERLTDNNIKRVGDLQKLKNCLERL